jgi:hypothetical protein
MKKAKKKSNRLGSVGALHAKRNKALDRVVAIYNKGPESLIEHGAEFMKALDALTLAHTETKFKFAELAFKI